MTIHNKALLADLTIGVFSNRRQDKQETAATIERHGAVAKAASVSKTLIDEGALKPIRSIARDAYAQFTTQTLPWVNGGPRILPTAIYHTMKVDLINMRDNFQRNVDALASQLPHLLADAPNRLGTLYKQEDMPTEEKILSSFKFDWDFTPIPTGADFRIDLSNAERDALAAEFESRFPEKLMRANNHLWERAYEVISHLADRLTKYKPAMEEGERAEHPFHASTIENVRELATILPKLNVLGDPALDQLARSMQEKLCGTDAPTLRESDALRAATAADAYSLLDLMKGAYQP